MGTCPQVFISAYDVLEGQPTFPKCGRGPEATHPKEGVQSRPDCLVPKALPLPLPVPHSYTAFQGSTDLNACRCAVSGLISPVCACGCVCVCVCVTPNTRAWNLRAYIDARVRVYVHVRARARV